MPKQAWNIFLGFLAILAIGGLGFKVYQQQLLLDKANNDLSAEHQKAEQAKTNGAASVNDLRTKNATLEKNLQETMKMVEGLESQKSSLEQAKATLENANNSLSTEITRLRQQIQEADALKTKLETDLKAQLQTKDVTISQLEGKLSVDILNRVLFDLGKAELKAEGKQILSDVATALEGLPNRPIHVIGHTDNIPFKGGSGRFRSNWELSAGRAVAAVQYLQTEAGIDPMRLAAVGHSEYHPIASNDSEAGRAQNRRITLVIMPEELKVEEPPAPKPEPEPEKTDATTTPDTNKDTDAKPETDKAGTAPTPDADKSTPSEDAAKTPAPAPDSAGANTPLPERNSATNAAPDLPKIPLPRARPESAPQPKG
jgi:chemotaxis protein MotB